MYIYIKKKKLIHTVQLLLDTFGEYFKHKWKNIYIYNLI